MERLYTSIAGEGPIAQPHNHAIDIPATTADGILGYLLGPADGADIVYDEDVELAGVVFGRSITIEAGVQVAMYNGILCARGGNVVIDGLLGAAATGTPGTAGQLPSSPGGRGANQTGWGGAGGDGGDGGVGAGSFAGSGGRGADGGILPKTLFAVAATYALAVVGGGGGGGGAGGYGSSYNAFGAGGRPGEGGGVILVLTDGTISGTGTIFADGENGQAGSDAPGGSDGAGGGGGGGGSGGSAVMVGRSLADTLTYVLEPGEGGAGGAGDGAGANGTAGADGTSGHACFINIETNEYELVV